MNGIFKPQGALKRGKNNPHPSGLQLIFSQVKVDLFSNTVWSQDAAISVQLAPAHFSLWNFFGTFFQTFSYVKIFCQGLLLPDDFWSDFIPMLVFNSHLAPDSTYFLIDLLPFCMHYGLFILLLFIGRSLIRLWALVMIFREQKYPWRNFINGK